MNVTLVTDQFYESNHGTSISAQRFYTELVKLGHNVRVLSINKEDEDPYSLSGRNFGKLINKLIYSQGFELAKPDEEKIKKSIEGADIVHIYLPFLLEQKTIKLCRKMNIPCVAGFHILPENITSTIYMKKNPLVNFSLWQAFYFNTYRYIKHIHCPSLMVAEQLVKHKFNSKLHVISNGYSETFCEKEVKRPEEYKDKFVIAMVGRFSREKRHDLLIKAILESKYKDKIEVVFAGKGPLKSHIEKLAKKLVNYPKFTFLTKEELCTLFNYADLYVHPADIEVEGMSAVEAIACGCVPLVSDSKKSATKQFTISKHSIFKNGNYEDLARKIDWWIEHPKFLKAHRRQVAKHAKQFSIAKSINYYIKMYEEAIKDFESDFDSSLKKNKPVIINNYKK